MITSSTRARAPSRGARLARISAVQQITGALALTVAMFLPGTILTSIIIHLNARNPDATLALAVRRGLAPVVIGLTISTAWVMLSTLSSDWRSVVMSFATAVLVLRTRLNPLWLIGAGALAGMLDII